MNIEKLVYWLKDVNAPILLVEGRLFIDRSEDGIAGVQQGILKYNSLDEAQRWINIFPISDFVNAFVSEDYQDAEGAAILAIFEASWGYQIRARYPGRSFVIERWFDDDSGDFGLWLNG